MNLKITQQIKLRARELSDETLANLERLGKFEIPNPTDLYAHDRFYLGYLGQVAFDEYLTSIGRQHWYRPIPDGCSHPGTFIFRWDDDITQKLQIYVTPYKSNRYIMIPRIQGIRFFVPEDVVVGMRIGGEYKENIGFEFFLEVKGFVYFGDMQLVGQYCRDDGKVHPTYRHELDNCLPIEMLIDRMAKQKVAIGG